MNTSLLNKRILPLFFKKKKKKGGEKVGELVLLVTIIPILLWLPS